MRVGENFAVNYMSRNNDSLWLWLDVKRIGNSMGEIAHFGRMLRLG